VVRAAESLPFVQCEFLALPLALSCAVQRILSTAQVPPPRRSDVKSEEANKPPLAMHLQLCRSICLGRLARAPRRIWMTPAVRTCAQPPPSQTIRMVNNSLPSIAIRLTFTQPTSAPFHLDLKQIRSRSEADRILESRLQTSPDDRHVYQGCRGSSSREPLTFTSCSADCRPQSSSKQVHQQSMFLYIPQLESDSFDEQDDHYTYTIRHLS
jgi:hypothetical protein